MLEAAFPQPGTLTIGSVTITVIDPGPLTRIAPFKGQKEAVSQAIAPLSFPVPNQSVAHGDKRIIWCGRGAALFAGPTPKGLDGIAAIVDLSDALITIQIGGEDMGLVLARWVPLNLSCRAFPQDATARSLLGHVQVSVTRVSEDLMWLMVPRTMVGSVWHELESAMESVARQR